MRFVLDGMLGKLTRWLRMMGHDAVYLNDAQDRDLVANAVKENRILLTSDVALYRFATARGADAYLVKGRTEAERLASLASRFKLDLSVGTTDSRCPTCGSPLAVVSKEDVKGKIPATTFNVFGEFWKCTNPECGKVYWQGSHWDNINATLEKAKKIQKRTEYELGD
jgi:uncharacterized protein with PIN domain